MSHIRPKGAPTTNSSKTSTGIVPFMERFSNSTIEVAQDGRRGALMLSINVNHPEVENFITAKIDTTKVTGANISVKVSDAFMQDVKNDELFPLRFPTTNKEGEFKKDIPAKKLWGKIVHQAWKSAEPGVLFWDKILLESPADCYGEEWRSISTNPCGEIPLCAYDSCRLLSINLYSFVVNKFKDKPEFAFDVLYNVAYKAQKIMDDVIDLENEKISNILKKIESDSEPDEIKNVEKNLWQKIQKKLISGRRTGLSGIGLADVFAAMGIKYGSDESIKLTEEIYKCIATASYTASIDMARDREAFPIFNLHKEAKNPFIGRIFKDLDTKTKLNYTNFGRRNIANLTIPPSGSISILAGISSGIEPVFNAAYRRRRKVDTDHSNVSFVDKKGMSWEEYTVLHRVFIDWFRSYTGFSDADDVLIRATIAKMPDTALNDLINKSPYKDSIAHEIDYKKKVIIQGTAQKWVDHSISVTQNLPKIATEKDVSDLMMLAYDKGCKGITIYREGSRDGVLLNLDSNEKLEIIETNAPKRPKDVKCDIFYPKINDEDYVVFVGSIKDKPFEIFCFKNYGLSRTMSSGIIRKVSKRQYSLLRDDGVSVIVGDIISKFETPSEEFATRLVSTALRHGTPVKYIVEQLNKANGDLFDYSKVMARTLKKYIVDGTATNQTCPDCGHSPLTYKGGCVECPACGWGKC